MIFFWLLFLISILFVLYFSLNIRERFGHIMGQNKQLEYPIRVQDPLTGMSILSPSEEKWLAEQKIRQDQEWNEFLKRKEKDTPLIYEKVYKEGINGRRILEISDLCWENSLSRTSVLFAVCYEDDSTIGIVSYDGIDFKPVVDGKFAETIQNLTELPRLEFDEGHINIHIKPDFYLIAQSRYPDYKWSIGGEGWSGGSACKKFGEHGLTFDVSES